MGGAMSRLCLLSAAVLAVGALATPALSAPKPIAFAAQQDVGPFGTAIGAGGLSDSRGGTDVNVTINGGAAVSSQDLNAVNTGNAINATSIVNGTINIGAAAFSGFNGVGNFVMNTGNQDNIQGALSVNIVATH